MCPTFFVLEAPSPDPCSTLSDFLAYAGLRYFTIWIATLFFLPIIPLWYSYSACDETLGFNHQTLFEEIVKRSNLGHIGLE